MIIAFGNDHAALDHRDGILAFLRDRGHTVIDRGTDSPESVHYPDFAKAACQEMLAGRADRVVLICGTGIGISLAANKMRGVRCAVCSDIYAAIMSRSHNNTNAIALRGRHMALENNLALLDAWLTTEFEGGRHQIRLDMVSEIETGSCGLPDPDPTHANSHAAEGGAEV